MDFVFRFYLLFSIGWIARSALYREMHERIEKGGKKWETYSTDVCVFSLLYCELNLKIRSNRKLHTLADFQWHSVFCCCCCRCLSTRISFTFYESDFDCHISMSGDTLFSSTRIIAWRSLCPYFFLLLSFRWFFPCVDCRYTNPIDQYIVDVKFTLHIESISLEHFSKLPTLQFHFSCFFAVAAAAQAVALFVYLEKKW